MVVTREIHLDPEADRILASVSELYDGDTDLALSDLLKSRESLDLMLNEFESRNSDELVRQRDLSERQFAIGDTVSWEEVKRHKGL